MGLQPRTSIDTCVSAFAYSRLTSAERPAKSLTKIVGMNSPISHKNKTAPGRLHDEAQGPIGQAGVANVHEGSGCHI